jgi:cytochrome c553
MTVFAQTVSKSVTSTSTTSTDLQRGKETFQHLCTACHGGRGDGKGPAASALTPRPTDLTRLAQRTGTSPTELVKAALKGTDPVVAHGSSGMMVWGAFFLADANGNQVTADAHIQDLAAFIESIQVKSRAATPAANRARP